MFRNYKDPQYKNWRLSVYKRDKHHCRWPGCNLKRKINAHHIMTWAKFPGLRFEVSNGITLCKYHHDLIKGMEDIYAPTFLKILANDRLQ
jgi:predicted restriction endonuclease